MTDTRSPFRRLLGLAVLAAVSAMDFARDRLYEAGAYVLNAGFAFACSIFAGFLRLAPSRVDELLPLERVKLTAAESRALAAAKRERPVIFAGWRMSPST